MPTYTVEISASNDDGTIWQALAPAENVEGPIEAYDLAEWTAQNQNIAEGDSGWRVRVWRGHDADTASEPRAEYVAGEDTLITALTGVTDRIARKTAEMNELTGRRDELVRQLMALPAGAMPRGRIVRASGLKEARLYQIRDGRR